MIKFSSRVWSPSRVFGACAIAAAALLTSGAAYGQGYSTDFNSGFTPNESLSGQQGWDTNDAEKDDANGNPVLTSGGQTIGQSDYVGVINNYSTSGTDYWAYLGGLEHPTSVPGTSPVYLFRDFTAPGTATAYAFNVDMAISSSSTFSNRDNFAWTFQNAAGATLFSVNFDQIAGSGNPFAVRYTTDTGLPNTTDVSTGSGILSDSKYHLTVSVSALGLASIALTPTGGTATTIASNIPVLNAGTVVDVAATWTITNNTVTANGGLTNAGGNALLFDNYGVAVPEPSTYAMIGLGLIAAAAYGRRRSVRA